MAILLQLASYRLKFGEIAMQMKNIKKNRLGGNGEESSDPIQTCMWVLIIAFPIKVARKKFQKGIPNCPHMMPARSNRGFGTWNIYSVISCLLQIYLLNHIFYILEKRPN